MLELLNQLDGFDARGDVKVGAITMILWGIELFFVFQVIMATNRIQTLDPALIRPGILPY